MLFEYFYMKERQNVYNTTYYIVKACFFAKRPKYPMGILWLWYGYPMVKVVFYPYFTITCPLFYLYPVHRRNKERISPLLIERYKFPIILPLVLSGYMSFHHGG